MPEPAKKEQALEISEARHSAVVNTMVDAVVTINERGVIESFNPAAERTFGYLGTEVVGKNVSLLMPDTHRVRHDSYLKHHYRSGEKWVLGQLRELDAQRKDGSTFPIELAVTDLCIPGKRRFSAIIRDISERREVERMKEEFVSTVSHELRTPLTAICGSLGLVTGGALGELPEKISALLQIANNNIERLQFLINDLLDMEKIESGKMDFVFQPQAVMPIVEKSVITNAGYAEQHNVRFEITGRLDVARINADAERLMQVMSNLLSNAAKFSPANATVAISVARHEGQIRISVHDSGPGIPKDFHPRLFDKFTQSNSSNTRQPGGTGLGLSIVRAIVHKHGGRIGFATSPDTGTTFHVDLPEHTP